MKKEIGSHFMHGGERTPQYFCQLCGMTHTKHSKIGKDHYAAWLIRFK